MTVEQGPTYRIDIEFNEADVRRVMARISNIIGDVLIDEFNKMGQASRRAFGQAEDAADKASRSFDNTAESTKRSARGLGEYNRIAAQVRNGLDAMEGRAKAVRAVLNDVGAPPELLSVYDAQIKKTLELQQEFQSDFKRIAQDPALLAAYEEQFRDIRAVFNKEIQATSTLLNSQRSKRVAETQQETALLIREQTRRNQLELANEQRVNRRRADIRRFALQQIVAIERAVGRIFRTTGTIATGAFRRVENGVRAMGRSLRRNRTDLNDGFQGALRQRETSLDRSFDRQERIVRQSVTQQSATIDRFERQTSTGVLGAATGRSRLGTLIGGGAAIGGGFLLARQFREGFEESVNLNESLNKTAQIFGEAQEAVVEFSESSVENLFTTQSVALEAASNFGIFGKSAGLAGDDLVDFSTELVQLATDLASFNNTTVDDAIVSLSAALRGEQEPIRRYGVLLDQQVLQQRAFAEGITDTVRKLTPQERVLAAYNEILAQTVDQQGDAARTADDFANSSRRAGAALTETFAAAARFLIPIATAITNAALPALQSLTRFIEGDVNPALRAFRAALIGAAAALTGFLVLKTATELVRLFGIALRGALTPLGLFVTAIAAVGAVIGVLAQRSEAFRVALGQIARAVLAGFGFAIQIAAQGLVAFGELLNRVVIPAVIRVAEVVASALLTAFQFAYAFITQVAIPVTQQLVQVFRDNLGPVLTAVAGVFTDVVIPAVTGFANTVLSVLSTVAEFISPITDGFLELGRAIASVFTEGDFGGLLDGLRSLGAGIATVFSNLGQLIYDAIRPQVERAVGFIVEAFNNLDLASIGAKILEVVRLVGFVLGNIVSDPRFITALAAIAAAAVVVGLKFIQGFIQGVQENLPELFDLLKDALSLLFEEAVEFAFSNPAIIAIAIGAAFAAAPVIGAFRRAGQFTGDEASRSFGRRFASGVRSQAAQNRNLLLGLFGGTAGLRRQADQVARQTSRQLQNSFFRNRRTLAALGETVDPIFPSGGFSAKNVEEQNKQIQALTRNLGESGAAMAVFRVSAQKAFSAVAAAGRSAAQGVATSWRLGLTQMRTDLSNARLFAGDAFAALRGQGAAIGQALGGAVLAGFGSVISGQQLGQGNTVIGLSGILASSLGAFAATGSGPVAVAVGGLGLLVSLFQDSGEAAAAAAAQIDRYTEALRGVPAAERAGAIADEVREAFNALPDEIRDILIDADFSTLQLSSIFTDTGGLGTIDAFSTLAERLGVEQETLSDAVDRLEGFGVDSIERLEEALTLGDQPRGVENFISGVLDDIGIDIAPGDPIAELSRVFDEANISAEDFVETLKFLTGQTESIASVIATLEDEALIDQGDIEAAAEIAARATAALQAQRTELGNLNAEYDQFGSYVAGAERELALLNLQFEDIGGEAGGGGAIFQLSQAVQSLFSGFADVDIPDFTVGTASLDDFVDKVNEWLRANFGESVQIASGDVDQIANSLSLASIQAKIFGDETEDAVQTLEEVVGATNLYEAAIRSLQSQRTDRINAQIEQTRVTLDAAKQAAQEAEAAITGFLTGNYQDTPQRLVDELITNVGNIGSRIEDGILQGGLRGDAAVRLAVGDFDDAIAGIIQSGFESGLKTQEEFATLLNPLFGAVDEEVTDGAKRILSNVDFEFGITPQSADFLLEEVQRALEGDQIETNVVEAFNANEAVRRIQTQLDALQSTLQIDVTFSKEQLDQELLELGASAELIASLKIDGVDTDLLQGDPNVRTAREAQTKYEFYIDNLNVESEDADLLASELIAISQNRQFGLTISEPI